MDLISGAALHGFQGLVHMLGGDPVALLETNGLIVADCGNSDAYLPLRLAIQAVERAAVATCTPDFGRRLADRQGIEILGAVGLAARTATTFGEALGIFERYMGGYSPAIAVPLVSGAEPGTMFLCWRATLPNLAPHPQTVELSLGITLRVLRLLLGRQYAPQSVRLPHDPLTPASDYERYFGCRAVFGSLTAGFTFLTSDLERRLTEEDPRLHREVLAQLSADPSSTPAVRAVAELVAPMLPAGTATVDVVAKQLGVHPKALQRRLADEGTSFTGVVDQVRRAVAERSLRDTDVGLAHLAAQLGFAEQSVLTRACQRWFGTSPSAHRDALRG